MIFSILTHIADPTRFCLSVLGSAKRTGRVVAVSAGRVPQGVARPLDEAGHAVALGVVEDQLVGSPGSRPVAVIGPGSRTTGRKAKLAGLPISGLVSGRN